jgi:photosystem II stability/assembly factor-like uncharacterized protein
VSKPLGRLLVAALVVADVALVVGVMRHVNQTPPPSSDVAGTTAIPSEPNDSAAPQAAYDFVPATSGAISLAGDQALLYATRGQCDGDAPGRLVVSINGGASIATSETGLASVLAVSAVSRTELRVVGADDECSVRRLRSTDGGDSWLTDPDDDLWYPDPTDATKIVSPQGSSEPGCTVTSLSQVGDDFGRVSCSDGTVRGSGDGKKWVELGRLDDVRVTSFTTFSAGVALAVYQGCAAQAFTTRDSGRTWAPGGCISGEPAQAIASGESGLAAVVADQLYVSDDAGKSWTQP